MKILRHRATSPGFLPTFPPGFPEVTARSRDELLAPLASNDRALLESLTEAMMDSYRRAVEDMRALLDQTLCFVLSGIEGELGLGIDWRAAGHGRNVLERATIYLAAMARDLVRIPLHHPEGIAQARFRARIRYIESTALPTVRYFLDHYPLSPHQRDALSSAVAELSGCIELVSDGRIRALDEWYATIDEFALLTERCARAADALAEAINERNSPTAADSAPAHTA